MPKPATPEVEETVIPQEIIDEDQGLAQDAQDTEKRAKAARQKSKEATTELDRFRWEMGRCPFGPMFSLRAYADGVEVSHETIRRSLNAWQTQQDKLSQDVTVCPCLYNEDGGTEPHHIPEAAPAEKKQELTDEQVDAHSAARVAAATTELKAMAVGMIATRWQVSEGTAGRHYRKQRDEAVRRFYEIEGSVALTVEEARPHLERIVGDLHREFKLQEYRLGIIRTWMATNRSCDVQEIQAAKVQQMFDSIERLMERKEFGWDEAEAERRDWDFKGAEAERMNNELMKLARIAVLELQRASVDLKQASLRLGKSMQKIEVDKIPMSDDERELIRLNVEDAWAIVRQAKSAITGSSDVDWDKALRKLTEEDAA